MTTRVSIVDGPISELERATNQELERIERHTGAVVLGVDVTAIEPGWSLMLITWVIDDAELRDIANSMAEDEDSDRQAAEQAAADDAVGRSRAEQEDSASGEAQNIEDVPY